MDVDFLNHLWNKTCAAPINVDRMDVMLLFDVPITSSATKLSHLNLNSIFIFRFEKSCTGQQLNELKTNQNWNWKASQLHFGMKCRQTQSPKISAQEVNMRTKICI